MKLKYFIFGLLALVFGSVLTTQFVFLAKANQSDINTVYLATGGGVTYTPVATTTSGVTFLTAAGASTTMAFSTQSADSLNLDIQHTPSTTDAVLTASVWFSEGTNGANCETTPLLCDWYRDDIVSVSGTTVTHASTTLQSWQPQGGANATTTTRWLISPIDARYTKIQFQVLGANAAIHVIAAKKSQRPN